MILGGGTRLAIMFDSIATATACCNILAGLDTTCSVAVIIVCTCIYISTAHNAFRTMIFFNVKNVKN